MNSRNRRIIDTGALRHNMTVIRESIPKGCKVCAVVKADGYGHGALNAARAAVEGGADMLAVATVGEGMQLREAGITADILVLGALCREEAMDGVRHRLIQTVCSEEMVRALGEAARESGIPAEAHLKVDTGMGRIGVRTGEERDAVLAAFAGWPEVRLTGAYTHLSDADGDAEGMAYTEEQFRKFTELTDGLKVMRHCANSAALHRRPDMALDMVRAGISFYGYPPVETSLALKPCMRWTAKVSYVKELPAGEYVSYGRTYRAEKPIRVATVTCGYGDGYHRAASEKAEVLIRGQRAKIIGRICMDQMMADITDLKGITAGDDAVLMGTDGSDEITAEDIARWAGTISYEILLSAGSRVGRETI